MVNRVSLTVAAFFTLSGVVLTSLVFVPVARAQDGPPPVAHEIEGREACLLCHATDGMVPSPPDHATYSESICLSCHATGPEASEPPSQPVPPGQTESCLQCHSRSGLEMTLDDGEVMSVYVDAEEYDTSVHGNKLLCTDCHTTITVYPHPEIEIPNRRAYNIAQYELCKHCHFDNYTKTLDSIHYELLSTGDLKTPICTDCHGAHNVHPPSQPRESISQTCSKCHQSVYNQYVNSVHGTALIEQNNYDVPVCTDCHTSHTIEDPRTPAFRLESVHICGNCHANAELMSRYGISSNVVNSYLNDFHGRTVALIEKETRDVWVEEAVCTDCHGIHDIVSVNSPSSPVIKANLVDTCAKCHQDASANFPDAWLSHYEPSIEKAPLIFIAKWFYWIMIPFVLVGLSAHILLDLWRRVTNR